MTNRDRAIKQAFEEGFRAGYYCAEPNEPGRIVDSYAEQAFEPWSRSNGDLLDGTADLDSRIAELEAKLERAQNLIEEM